MPIQKNDIIMISAAIIGLMIVGLSLYALFNSPLNNTPFDEKRSAAFKDLFDVIVKGTLLPLFTTLIATKVAYVAAVSVVRVVQERSDKKVSSAPDP